MPRIIPKQLFGLHLAKVLTAFPQRKQSVRCQGFRCQK